MQTGLEISEMGAWAQVGLLNMARRSRAGLKAMQRLTLPWLSSQRARQHP